MQFHRWTGIASEWEYEGSCSDITERVNWKVGHFRVRQKPDVREAPRNLQ